MIEVNTINEIRSLHGGYNLQLMDKPITIFIPFFHVEFYKIQKHPVLSLFVVLAKILLKTNIQVIFFCLINKLIVKNHSSP